MARRPRRPRSAPILALCLALAAVAGCGGVDPGDVSGPIQRPAVPARPAVVPAEPGPVGGGGANPAGQGGGNGGAPSGLERDHWVGVWRAEVADIFGISSVETVLQAGGTFNNQVSNPGASYLLTVWGQWEVFTFTDEPVLRFAVEGWEPREFCGPQTCTPVTIPTGQSQHFRFLDASTVVLRDPSCADVSCEVTYYRAM